MPGCGTSHLNPVSRWCVRNLSLLADQTAAWTPATYRSSILFFLPPPQFPAWQLLWRNALSVHGQVKLLSLLQQQVGACRGLERCVSSKIFYWSLHISCRLLCRSCRFHCRRSCWQGKGFTSGCRRHADQEEFMNGLRTAWSPWAKCLWAGVQCVFISESMNFLDITTTLHCVEPMPLDQYCLNFMVNHRTFKWRFVTHIGGFLHSFNSNHSWMETTENLRKIFF